MATSMNTFLWQQFGAAIDMMENAINACPAQLWNEETAFCRLAHHTIFFLDYYLSDATPKESAYTPPPPFTKLEFEDVPTLEMYTKEQILKFLGHARQKLLLQLGNNTPEDLLSKRFVSEYRDFTLFELLLYNMRHVQHHAAQLNMLLRQHGITPPNWVSRTKGAL